MYFFAIVYNILYRYDWNNYLSIIYDVVFRVNGGHKEVDNTICQEKNIDNEI